MLDLRKMVSAIPAAQHPEDDYGEQWDYSHVLTPEHRQAGYSLKVNEPYGPSGNMFATLHHNGQELGTVHGLRNQDGSLEPHADALPLAHRGRGLGRAMYEGLFAHAYHKRGIGMVRGGAHSLDASRVHQSLSRRHGTDYKPQQVAGDESEHPFGAYSYALKSELAKAISDIKPGGAEAGKTDYSHILAPEHREAGYGLVVLDGTRQALRPDLSPDPLIPPQKHIQSLLTHQGEPVGRVHGLIDSDNTVEPHADHLPAAHRGRGFGRAMYEAMLAHAYHVHGVRQVEGMRHTEEASRVHQSLARRHGVGYKAKIVDSGSPIPMARYGYALKSERLKELFGTLQRDPDRGDPRQQLGTRPSIGEFWTNVADVPVDELVRLLRPKAIDRTRAASIKEARNKGVELPAIEIGVYRGGGLNLIDGNHRLVEASKRRDSNIKTTFTFEDPPDHLKKAIATIPPGTPGQGHTDYSHLLKPEHRDAGLKIHVRDGKFIGGKQGGKDCIATAFLMNGDKEAGYVTGLAKTKKSFEPHSRLHAAFRGQGLGRLMYEALYHYTKSKGFSRVAGGDHSEAAHLVHQSLSRRHGFNYAPKASGGTYIADDEGNVSRAPHGKYSYILKNQTPPTFPRLGVPDNRRETPMVEGLALENKRRLTGSTDHRYAGATVAREPGGGAAPAVSYVDTWGCQNPRATKQHEDFHHMLRRVENIHGQPSRAKVVAHLMAAIPQDALPIVGEQTARSYPGLNPNDPDHHEEVLAELCSYVNGGKPGPRLIGGHLLPGQIDKDKDRAMKTAWRAVCQAARTIGPGHIGEGAGLQKTISDIESGTSDNDPDFPDFDYSHILTPEHRAAGYRLTVSYNGEYPAAFLEHNNKTVGQVRGEFHERYGTWTLTPHSRLDIKHRGHGLGSAMYEALMAHSLHYHDIDQVAGAASEDAAAVHQRLADKHGHHVEGHDTADGWRYNYTIKSEDPLAKMISAIPAGAASTNDFGDTAHDYSHVLKPEHRAAGYSLRVTEPFGQGGGWSSILSHKGEDVGNVWGTNHGDAIEPHANELHPAHRGRGLGVAMYEGLYAHVLHNGIKTIRGGGHTEAASRVHQSLARKHGVSYTPHIDAPGEKYPHAAYEYAIKGEKKPGKKQNLPSVEEKPHEFYGRRALEKSFAEMAQGRQPGGAQQWNYSHLLPEHLRSQMDLIVHEKEGQIHAKLWAKPGSAVHSLLDQSLLGSIGARFRGFHGEDNGLDVAKDPSTASYLHANLRGRGLGKMLYNALFAHATTIGRHNVVGGEHSAEAGRVHQSLAREHGLPAADRHTGYHYILKGELEKSLRDTEPGAEVEAPAGAAPSTAPSKWFDYSHTLPAGDDFKLYVQDDTRDRWPAVAGHLYHNGKNVGMVRAYLDKDGKINPHSELMAAYRGRGFGRALYEATLAHAMRFHQTSQCYGACSDDAACVHMSMRKRHGMFSEGDKDDYPYDYSYTLKNEQELRKAGIDPMQFSHWLLDKDARFVGGYHSQGEAEKAAQGRPGHAVAVNRQYRGTAPAAPAQEPKPSRIPATPPPIPPDARNSPAAAPPPAERPDDAPRLGELLAGRASSRFTHLGIKDPGPVFTAKDWDPTRGLR